MKLVRFDVVQTEGLSYLRQVECHFADELGSQREGPSAEHITFRVSIEFEDEPLLNDCLVKGLKEARNVIVEEIKRRSGE